MHISLVVIIDTKHIVILLLNDVLRTVPEYKLLVEAVSGIILSGFLLDARTEGLRVSGVTVLVTAAVGVTSPGTQVTSAVAGVVKLGLC